jgi:hypothetical protein
MFHPSSAILMNLGITTYHVFYLLPILSTCMSYVVRHRKGGD